MLFYDSEALDKFLKSIPCQNFEKKKAMKNFILDNLENFIEDDITVNDIKRKTPNTKTTRPVTLKEKFLFKMKKLFVEE